MAGFETEEAFEVLEKSLMNIQNMETDTFQ